MPNINTDTLQSAPVSDVSETELQSEGAQEVDQETVAANVQQIAVNGRRDTGITASATDSGSRGEQPVPAQPAADAGLVGGGEEAAGAGGVGGSTEPAFEPNAQWETIETFSRHMDKVPDDLRYEHLEQLSQDTSLPEDLRAAYAELHANKDLFDRLDSARDAKGLSGSHLDNNDGRISHTDLRTVYNDGEFVAYNREKSVAYTQNYVPSDAQAGDTAPRAITESDANRELYLYADSLPDTIDEKALQQIVDGQVNGKCPAQLKAAAQYMLDNPEARERLLPGGSVSRGQFEDNALASINFREDELEALEVLGENKDLFMREKTDHWRPRKRENHMSKETLDRLANDESAPEHVREAAATLRDSPVLRGLLDNGTHGHTKGVVHDNKVLSGDIDGAFARMTDANRTAAKPAGDAPPSANGSAASDLAALVLADMTAGMADDPAEKATRGKSGLLGKFLRGLSKALDIVKTGLDVVASFCPPGIGGIVAGISAGVSAVNNFGVKAGLAISEGVPPGEAMKDAAKDFAFDAAASAASAIPVGGVAVKGAVMGAKQVAMATAREGGEALMREGGEALMREGGEKLVREGGEKLAREGGETTLQKGTKETAEETAEEAGEEGFVASFKQGVKDTAEEEATVQMQTLASEKLGIEIPARSEEDGTEGGGGRRRGRGSMRADDGPDLSAKRSDNTSSKDDVDKSTRSSDVEGDKDASKAEKQAEKQAERDARREERQQEQDLAAEQTQAIALPLPVILPYLREYEKAGPSAKQRHRAIELEPKVQPEEV